MSFVNFSHFSDVQKKWLVPIKKKKFNAFQFQNCKNTSENGITNNQLIIAHFKNLIKILLYSFIIIFFRLYLMQEMVLGLMNIGLTHNNQQSGI